MSKYLTATEAAALVGVTPTAITLAIKAGKLTRQQPQDFPPGRNVYLLRSEVTTWAKRRARGKQKGEK